MNETNWSSIPKTSTHSKSNYSEPFFDIDSQCLCFKIKNVLETVLHSCLWNSSPGSRHDLALLDEQTQAMTATSWWLPGLSDCNRHLISTMSKYKKKKFASESQWHNEIPISKGLNDLFLKPILICFSFYCSRIGQFY